MGFASQWRDIERHLPQNWGDARLQVTARDESDSDRVASLLGPANPARRGNVFRFYVARRGTGPAPDAVRRLLRRLDTERIRGTVELLASDEAHSAPETARGSLREEWDALVQALPADWSDMYAELVLRSSDYHERAALLLSPLNPTRYGAKPGFRFRVARLAGYGASEPMARRCFERLDEARIPGELDILRVLSDTDNVATQGPVWYIGGRAV
jgi:hypothetical protein